MDRTRRLAFLPSLLVAFALAIGLAACSPSQEAEQATTEPTAEPEPTAIPEPQAHLYIFHNPNKVTEIDAETNQVIRTVEVNIPGGGRWASTDSNNYYDGANLWVGTRGNEGDSLDVLALNLDTFEVTARVPLATGTANFYIGKATSDGVLPVGMRDLGTFVTVDTVNFQVLNTFDAPLDIDASGNPLYKADLPEDETTGGGMVVCDADVTKLADGREVFVYPTQGSELVITLDPYTGEFIGYGRIAEGSKGNMLTTHPLNGTIWAQENRTNSQAVLDPNTLEVIGRIPTPGSPIVNSYSPDGKIAFINGGGMSATTVANAETYEVIANVEAGARPRESVAHPNGRAVYMLVDQENAVAIVDPANWQVVGRIELSEAPSAAFIRAIQ